MSCTLRRPPHRDTGRCLPRLERLESRLALSASTVGPALDATAARPISASDTSTPTPTGPYLTTVSTSPADGAVLSTPPSTVTVSFDRPLAAGFLCTFKVVIERQSGSAWSDAYDSRNAPTETLDPTGTQLTLTTALPLAPGTYRLVIPASTTIVGADGSSLAGPYADRPIASFTVNAPVDRGRGGATPLNLPESTVVGTAGSLDLKANPGAVDLYSVTLPAGHFWRLGAEVQASRVGSPLQSTLSLFDAQGRLVATASVGRPDTPTDPYLFQGLAPGTYYLGVSGHDNVPGSTGYPASALTPGSEAGGTYRLGVVADPADAPTRLLGSSLHYADPTDPHPTGFSLAFSGPLDTTTLHGNTSAGVRVVNQDGRVFGVTAVGQNEAAARYDFLFDADLPAGHYSIIVPAGGVTDLAGYAPVAGNQPAGLLATFDVRGAASTDPRDIGPLGFKVHKGLTWNDAIAPGSAVTYRFVATSEGSYDLGTEYTGGSLSVQLLGGRQSGTRDAGPEGQTTDTVVYLTPGVYYARFLNTGKTPTALTWTLNSLTSWDSLLNNGVGQGPALDLRLVNPTTSGFTPSPQTAGEAGTVSAATPSGGSTAAATVGQPQALYAGLGANATLAPAGLPVTLGSTLVGRPSNNSDHVAAVGHTSGSGTTALASRSSGLPGGIRYTTTAARFAPVGESADAPGASGRPESDTDVAPVNGALVAADAGQEPRPDDAVIAAADQLTRAGRVAARLMGLAPDEASDLEPAGAPAEPIALTRDDSPASGEQVGHLERAHLDTPVALGLATMMSFRFHQPLLRWLKKARAGSRPARASALRSAAAGPHSRS